MSASPLEQGPKQADPGLFSASRSYRRIRVGMGRLAVRIPPIRDRNVRKEFFEAAEFDVIVNALPEYLQDLARFAYLRGWRRGDMLNLKWAAVDLERGVIPLFQGETENNEGRTLAIAGPLAEIMARRYKARLVERPNGEPIVADFVFHHAGRPIVDYRRA